ncbi:MAG: D-2-hydroxyacid dehydrogenase [Clostridia bacterium]|nr:D-2-hydroxyacid dehydrogenase [Clostridia bacterium]
MKIIILDGFTVNPGDLSWDWLGEYGDYTVYDRTERQDILSRCEGADIVITNKTPLGKDILCQLPDVKFIDLLSTGYNITDIHYARERGIPVSNVPSYSTNSVAQLTFAFILQFASRVAEHSSSTANGDWQRCEHFCYMVAPLTELAGKTLGIIGYGSIGKAVAKIAEAFNMKVLVNTNHPGEDSDNIKFCEIDTLLANSDFVSLHCPLTEKTEKMANKSFFAKMKKSAYFINTSRGATVDEDDLKEALENGVIAGAGLDVLLNEPPIDDKITSLENTLVTPHIAWAAKETRARLMEVTKQNIKAFANGNPINVVN